jgi:DNA topoisomerase-1
LPHHALAHDGARCGLRQEVYCKALVNIFGQYYSERRRKMRPEAQAFALRIASEKVVRYNAALYRTGVLSAFAVGNFFSHRVSDLGKSKIQAIAPFSCFCKRLNVQEIYRKRRSKAVIMAKSLIIVESPAKTKTIKGFLGKDYAVEASMGHVRDLPEKGMGVDIENDFKPTYEPLKDRKDVLDKLRTAAKGAETVYLASDPDREGEAIAWHVAEALKLKPSQIKRIQFNEITRSAVQDALKNPRAINMERVNAQQARRVLDRLVGYKLSPVLREKISQRLKLSAGRVQSVAVRLICDREREILAFTPVEYWSVTAHLSPVGQPRSKFEASLIQYQGKKIELKNADDARRVYDDLGYPFPEEKNGVLPAFQPGSSGAEFTVKTVKKSERQRRPYAPFITSTLQQEAARKIGFSSKRTMTVAQQLYEGIDLGADGGQTGLITYMRTDSTRVAVEAQADAKQFIEREYGPNYAPEKYNVYKSKGAAQDAHEAVRPTSVFRTPDSIKGRLNADQYRLYRLIWLRFVASQMTPAIMDVVQADIQAREYIFRATGSTIKFDGFLKVYTEGKDNPAQVDDDEKPPLPPLTEKQALDLLNLLPKQHFTEPPPRFTEATLVKGLEEQGIGRPSTYASIISVIQDRAYVELTEKKFRPTDLGFAVTDLLIKHFPEIMDVKFTAGMEDQLDKVADGEQDWVSLMKDFYGPFAETLKKANASTEKVVRETDKTCPNCGSPLVERFGRFGKFLSCSNYPECKFILKDAVAEGAEGEAKPEPVVSEITCPNCGRHLVEKKGRFGTFLGCPGYPECKYIHKTVQTTGVKCPSCGEGEMAQKRSPKGFFFGCTNYPKCRFTLPSKPVGRECPVCQAPLIEKFEKGEVTGVKCSNRACGYLETNLPAEEKPETMVA